MTRLQGFILLSSERGGIRIEYAKNKMGEVGVLCKSEFIYIISKNVPFLPLLQKSDPG